MLNIISTELNMTELQEKYEKEIKSALKERFKIDNDNAIPTLEKIIVNAGIGKEFTNNQGVVEEMSDVIAQITGQKPVVTYSKDAISNFKLRANTPNGIMATLRKDLMWNFMYKIVNIALPRVKDFRGISRKSFDSEGNYTLGIREHIIFPEIDTSKLTKIRSLQVVIVTSTKDKEQSLALLELLGMPFKKDNRQAGNQ